MGFAECIARVTVEADRAEVRYGPFTSTHEALGVLLEEWDELRAAVHANNVCAVRDEAVQIAAVATRLAALCQRAHEAPDGMATPFARRSFPKRDR